MRFSDPVNLLLSTLLSKTIEMVPHPLGLGFCEHSETVVALRYVMAKSHSYKRGRAPAATVRRNRW